MRAELTEDGEAKAILDAIFEYYAKTELEKKS